MVAYFVFMHDKNSNATFQKVAGAGVNSGI